MHMRGGVKEQTQVIQELRKLSRVDAKMGAVRGFSLLSADPLKGVPSIKVRRKYKKKALADNAFSKKARRF